MLIFADTSDADAVKSLDEMRLIDGVTTNPTILLQGKVTDIDVVHKLSGITDKQIHVQVMGNTVESIVKRAEQLVSLSKQVVIKLPITAVCIKACSKLRALGIDVNMTLCFSPLQALMAAKAGASFVSIFVGRLDDVGVDGLRVVNECCEIWQNYPEITTRMIVASVRNMVHVTESAKLGVDAITVSPSIIYSMLCHHLTDIGIEKFREDSMPGVQNQADIM